MVYGCGQMIICFELLHLGSKSVCIYSKNEENEEDEHYLNIVKLDDMFYLKWWWDA